MIQKKVLVIGLDGATFDIINPLIEKGKLPNIAKLMKTGSYGELLSTVPHLSPVAWTSFFTGCNPGKHGIFDFFHKIKGSYSVKINNFNHCKTKGIWDYLNESASKVIAINIPNTYPPPKIDGCFISGLGTPNKEVQYCYPPELKDEIIEKFGTFEMLTEIQHSDKLMHRYIAGRDRVIKNQTDVVKYLLKNKPWDLFIHVFTITDSIQHDCWKYIDNTHPNYSKHMNKNYGHIIDETYEMVDQAIGEFLKEVSDDTTVVLLSDHGQGPLKKTLSLNNVLKSKGYLCFKDNANVESQLSLKINRIISKAKKIPMYIVSKFLTKKQKDKLFFHIKEEMVEAFFKKAEDYLASIDWSKTKAYCEGSFSLIYLNKRDFYPEGIVNKADEKKIKEELKDIFMNLKDNETGENITEAIYEPHEIYKGDYIENAPDLIIILKKGYHGSGSIDRVLFNIKEDEFFSSHQWSGFHVPEGIFVLNDKKRIKADNKINDAKIIDLTPTILYLMGKDVPKEIDGKVLKNCVNETFLQTNAPKFSDETVYANKNFEDSFSEEEDENVKKQLSDLGYL